VVEDDGIGFDGLEAPGLGLKTMKERLRPFGGRLEIRSEPGSGTEIEVEVPV
jgi:signal transduction histidine kinase